MEPGPRVTWRWLCVLVLLLGWLIAGWAWFGYERGGASTFERVHAPLLPPTQDTSPVPGAGWVLLWFLLALCVAWIWRAWRRGIAVVDPFVATGALLVVAATIVAIHGAEFRGSLVGLRATHRSTSVFYVAYALAAAGIGVGLIGFLRILWRADATGARPGARDLDHTDMDDVVGPPGRGALRCAAKSGSRG